MKRNLCFTEEKYLNTKNLFWKKIAKYKFKKERKLRPLYIEQILGLANVMLVLDYLLI